jgi:hypothetical protein
MCTEYYDALPHAADGTNSHEPERCGAQVGVEHMTSVTVDPTMQALMQKAPRAIPLDLEARQREAGTA